MDWSLVVRWGPAAAMEHSGSVGPHGCNGAQWFRGAQWLGSWEYSGSLRQSDSMGHWGSVAWGTVAL